jgi:acetyl-CoA synthetase
LNIAYEAIDQHATGAHRDQVALRWLSRDGDVREFTYGDMQALTNRFATS